ncbi:unnamed protein product [Caenorhabditis sp. 36 PRJEB53466]|nr:unnamed protein product [Caenorhabditis sp. 36 PRJEB53466]
MKRICVEPFLSAEDDEMLEFLAGLAQNATSPLDPPELWGPYRRLHGSAQTVEWLEKRFRANLAPFIHLLSRFDTDTKLRMLFVSRTRFKEDFMETLKAEADVEMDGEECIVRLRESGEVLQAIEPRRPHFTGEDMDILHFLARKARETNEPICMDALWTEYMESGRTSRSVENIKQHFRAHLAPGIPEMSEFDLETKVRMLFVSHSPIDEHFLTRLREQAAVKVSTRGGIQIYKEHREGGLELCKMPPKRTEEEEVEESKEKEKTEPKRRKRGKKRRESEKGGEDEVLTFDLPVDASYEALLNYIDPNAFEQFFVDQLEDEPLNFFFPR